MIGSWWLGGGEKLESDSWMTVWVRGDGDTTRDTTSSSSPSSSSFVLLLPHLFYTWTGNGSKKGRPPPPPPPRVLAPAAAEVQVRRPPCSFSHCLPPCATCRLPVIRMNARSFRGDFLSINFTNCVCDRRRSFASTLEEECLQEKVIMISLTGRPASGLPQPKPALI